MHACACVHIGFETKKRTSLGQPLRAAERPTTSAVGAAARPRMYSIEPQPLAATRGSLGSPAWVGVCGERVHGRRAAALTSALRRRCRSLKACGDVVSGRTRATDGMVTR